MKRDKTLQMQNNIADYLSYLPRRMLSLYGQDNVTEFVLHDLCDEKCFNLKKAAYLVDNPDFNCLKGVAGFSRDDCSLEKYDIWRDRQKFSDRMKEASFNQKVRQVSRCSLRASENHDNADLANEVAQDLGLNDFNYCSWDLKHGNHGILIFEKSPTDCSLSEESLLNGASLLSFCPVF